MRWIDCCGPPGVGKSALLDRDFPPRGIPRREPPYPGDWGPFLSVVDGLLERVRGHRSFAACKSMTHRSFSKMNAVARRDDPDVYRQTGFLQRGLGFGWRLVDLGLDADLVRPYFDLMPVSVGAAFLWADVETIQERNRTRVPVKDRSFMVPLMEAAMQIAMESLTAREVPICVLDMRRPITETYGHLRAFADSHAASTRTAGVSR